MTRDQFTRRTLFIAAGIIGAGVCVALLVALAIWEGLKEAAAWR